MDTRPSLLMTMITSTMMPRIWVPTTVPLITLMPPKRRSKKRKRPRKKRNLPLLSFKDTLLVWTLLSTPPTCMVFLKELTTSASKRQVMITHTVYSTKIETCLKKKAKTASLFTDLFPTLWVTLTPWIPPSLG